MEFLAIRGPEEKAASVGRQIGDRAPIDIRHRLFLEPFAVPDEQIDRHRLRSGKLVDASIPIEAQLVVRITEVRGARAGAQKHPGRHVPLPECHRLAEDSGLDALRAQVRGGGKPIGARADDGDFTS